MNNVPKQQELVDIRDVHVDKRLPKQEGFSMLGTKCCYWLRRFPACCFRCYIFNGTPDAPIRTRCCKFKTPVAARHNAECCAFRNSAYNAPPSTARISAAPHRMLNIPTA